ncbi:MAG: hypothetical protein COU11_01245 [Candidatus Harrisonbacteria bacterium CG10_big_fil_rev_8_21_14_0_10_49_15]|uniref:Pyridoxamine 5'-phosphate oxidase N-terminal domain-containing protein n=1 Tax=Candidatus Harrisonbacteria bacterium CG10_big_fil_rev_8_21_14_0_10_49_15 TaxID=1974587 RepID=A0A2H0UNE2_9BACT|nr:MAG: hypothetical protein COU11_01245 [Candidatus Harrisonbacteria bacterium CG10_big_fil_rev_8_21_14_0_10_49_15]
MNAVNPDILKYLKTQRAGVIALEMTDGSPHAATVHFAHTEDPFIFYFETYREYRKAEPILRNEVTRASFVVGTAETDMKTLQIDGVARHSTDEKLITEVYLAKFPNKKPKRDADPDKFIFFSFTPRWWRFTDWTHPDGKIVISSE